MGARISKTGEDSLRIPIGGNEIDKVMQQPQRSRPRFNRVKTTKYTWLTFIPLNFYEQFRRAVYFYFLVITIVSFFVNTTMSPMVSLIPLLFVMIVTALKEGHEDYSRFKSDKVVNRAKVNVIRDGKEQQICSEYIMPGDLVVVYRDCDVPCDLVLLQSTDKHDKCFVTTANLDGETNLKTLFVPRGLPPPTESVNLKQIGDIVCETPTKDLYSFNGRIELKTTAETTVDNNVLPLTVDNMLLRGARLKNTERVVACAVYTGMCTKLQLNSRYTGNKSASSEVYINKFIAMLILGMFACVLVLYMLERHVEKSILPEMAYLGIGHKKDSFVQIVDDFLSFLILFNYMVPISMYMNIELYRVFGAFFMRSDLQLYDMETDEPCIVNTSNLNEDLGQINILFSDKTGTLTKNEMNFVACSLGGQKYRFRKTHLENVAASGELYKLEDFDAVKRLFFEALSICHTVQVLDNATTTINNLETLSERQHLITDHSKDIYQASSPDEKALLEACAALGIIYDGDVNDCFMRVRCILNSNESEICYERLHILEFTSERKRMSIIVRDANGTIWLYSKGAESSIFPLCAARYASLISETDKHITEFAQDGLRTLAVARRQVSIEEYEDFIAAHNAANSALDQRQQLIAECYAKLENELELLGATAVEDALQDNVAETLTALQNAGLKIWVLTGDKVETALNIGLACKHIPQDANIGFIVDITDGDELKQRLKLFKRSIKENKKAGAAAKENALVIDGKSLETALLHEREKFCKVALMCKAVLCCRLSPLQKSEVVTIIKRQHKYFTAAIGDGANDVSMIQEAHVGIGIIGREGRQAARCSDYAIAKFSMLQRLLLIHGHYNSARLAFLVLFYCYKNIVITGCMVLFQIYDFFSATSVYSGLYLWFFDILYLSYSFTFLAFTEKPYSEEVLLRHPALYKKNAHNRNATWSTFGYWMLNGFYHTGIIFYFAYFTIYFNNIVLNGAQPADFYCFGTMLMTLVIFVCNLKLFLIANYMSYVNIILIGISLIVFMLSTYIYNAFVGNNELAGVYNQFVTSLPMWLYVIVTTVACLLPDFTVKVLRQNYRIQKTKSKQFNFINKVK